jgi:hypothetical protein
MKSYGRDRARLQLQFLKNIFTTDGHGWTRMPFNRETLCGSVQAVQKTARAAGGLGEIKGVFQNCGGWHARCITRRKLKSRATKMTGSPPLVDAARGDGGWHSPPARPKEN